MSVTRYCLDTSALIEPWNKYYSMDLCPEYWAIIDELAQKGRVFCPMEVKREIERVDDNLRLWIKDRDYLFRDPDETVQNHLREILLRFRELVDTKKQRSMADPWVIAHAIAEGATVVTKEAEAPSKIKIPDVCRALKVPCIDDIEFLREIGVKFTAHWHA